jgi:hypothetical protein
MSGGSVAVEHIHTYLVHPGKGAEGTPEIGGTNVPLSGKLFRMLDEIYAKSDIECDIDISFNHSPGGVQQNPCRDLVLTYLRGATIARGRHIATRLEKVTTNRSGLGLLFLISGTEGRDHKIVISRFPADTGILAEQRQQGLTVEFLESVFMKSATSYKAALYQDSSLTAGFWTGRAVDKQINNRTVKLSNYWIAEFLDSDFRTTAAAGTRRLAIALRDAARKSSDLAVKQEITSAATLAQSLAGQLLSMRTFEDRFWLSAAAREAIAKEIRLPNLLDDRFQFDWEEFSKQVAYRSVELNTGVIVTAESATFNDLIHREPIDDGNVRITTEGRVTSEKLGKTPR